MEARRARGICDGGTRTRGNAQRVPDAGMPGAGRQTRKRKLGIMTAPIEIRGLHSQWLGGLPAHARERKVSSAGCLVLSHWERVSACAAGQLKIAAKKWSAEKTAKSRLESVTVGKFRLCHTIGTGIAPSRFGPTRKGRPRQNRDSDPPPAPTCEYQALGTRRAAGGHRFMVAPFVGLPSPRANNQKTLPAISKVMTRSNRSLRTAAAPTMPPAGPESKH